MVMVEISQKKNFLTTKQIKWLEMKNALRFNIPPFLWLAGSETVGERGPKIERYAVACFCPGPGNFRFHCGCFRRRDDPEVLQ